MKRNRLTDNDRSFGPFTLGERSEHYRPLGLSIESGDEEYPGCALHLRALGWTLRVNLPQIVRPWRRKVVAQSWGPETVAYMGRDWYWDVHPREYGFSITEGHLNVRFGRITGDSQTEQRWGCFLPWTQWRHVRTSLYDLQGQHYCTEHKGDSWEVRQVLRDACPTVSFTVQDYDGSHVVAKTRIEEREWRFGEKWCSWLSVFRKSKVKRSLDIDFASEVGRDKGSWKGGLMGTSIEMLPGELHEAAFRRFCAKDIRNKNGASRIALLEPA